MSKSENLLSNNTMISKKISKIVDSDLEADNDTLDAIKGLSLFLSENNLSSRRNLRSNLEKRSLIFNEQFLQCFGDAKRVIDALHNDLNSINDCCQQINSRLQIIKDTNFKLLSETNRLRDEWKRAQDHQNISNKFCAKFQLKPSEIALIKGVKEGHQNITIDDQFFDTFCKIRCIHENSKMLLETHQQITGIETMDSMAALEEVAFERLYKWTLNILRTYNSDFHEMSPLLCKSMQFLEERTVLFKYCLSEYVLVRRAAVVRNFIDALTRGGPSSNPLPIDLLSNDPIRYVGDMLAWIHQAIASEKELLEMLLQKCNQKELQDLDIIRVWVSSISESLVRPIKVRIEQLLISNPNSKMSYGPIVLFKVNSLLKFYHRTLAEELTPESALMYTMEELDSLANRVFINSLNFHCSYELGKTTEGNYEEPRADLLPTEPFNKTISLIEQVLSFQESSLLLPSDKKKVVETIVNVVVKTLLQVCRICASKLTGLEMSIFMLNCLHDVYSIFKDNEHSCEFTLLLKTQMNDYLDALINERTMNIIAYFGLTAMNNAIKNEASIPLSLVTGCDALAIQSCPKKIDSFLANPEIVELPQLSLLQSNELRNEIKMKSVALLCEIYKEIYDSVHKKENEFDEPDLFLTHSPDVFKALVQ